MSPDPTSYSTPTSFPERLCSRVFTAGQKTTFLGLGCFKAKEQQTLYLALSGTSALPTPAGLRPKEVALQPGGPCAVLRLGSKMHLICLASDPRPPLYVLGEGSPAPLNG